MRKIIKYGLAVIQNHKLLLVRERHKEKFLMPGGRPRKKETILQTLKREIEEELGITLLSDSLEYYGTFEDVAANERDTIVQMQVYFGKVKGDLRPSGEIEELKWFYRGNSTENLSPVVKNKILPSLLKDGYV